MRFVPDIGSGTRGYPEPVARRLRAVNVTALAATVVSVAFLAATLMTPAAATPSLIALNVGGCIAFACVPLLHRVGAHASSVAFVLFAEAFIFLAMVVNGTGGYGWLYCIVAAGLAVLFLGTERPVLSALLGAMSVFLAIAALLWLPSSTGRVPPDALRLFGLAINLPGATAMLYATVAYAMRQVTRAEAEAERERARSEALLANILPARVAQRLKDAPGTIIADEYPTASVLFADMAGFTQRAADTGPQALVGFLNDVFGAFDALVAQHGLEKIKTTGDAYMVVAGLPEPRADPAPALADFALAMRDCARALRDPRGRAVPIRIGIASGPVVAGVVGTRKFFYDVWGDTVNLAARMEQTGEPGRIQLCPATARLLGAGYALEARGAVEVKGKGRIGTWYLNGRAAAPKPLDSAAGAPNVAPTQGRSPMYEYSIPVYRKGLAALSKILDKAAAYCAERKIDPSVLLTARLFPDMLPFTRQVQIATDHARRGPARLVGREPMSMADTEASFDDLKARIAKTIEHLDSYTAADFDGAATRQITFPVGQRQMTMSGVDYLNNFSMPNYWFHLTTAYDILRHNGVPLGKSDFLGA